MKLFLINVGVNASHGTLKSPLFEDQTFQFVPIPEPASTQIYKEELTTYEKLFGNAAFIPRNKRMLCTHDDPEFTTLTYGDFPMRSGRAALLRRAEIGDILLFLARLVPWHGERFSGNPGFYLVGQLRVGQIFKDIFVMPGEGALKEIKKNAHVKRSLADKSLFDGFWVFKGDGQSGLYEKAVPFTLDLAASVLTDRHGEPWKTSDERTDLQVIGSYTRSCRIISDPAKVSLLLGEIEKWKK